MRGFDVRVDGRPLSPAVGNGKGVQSGCRSILRVQEVFSVGTPPDRFLVSGAGRNQRLVRAVASHDVDVVFCISILTCSERDVLAVWRYAGGIQTEMRRRKLLSGACS